jgi:hypothetical protein
MKTVTIHIRGVEHADTYTPIEAKNLTINEAGYVEFVAVDGTLWHSELSEVNAITLT